MRKNTYIVDVASFQPSDLSSYKRLGATGAIVKVTEGTTYRNPKAQAQINSAKALGMEVHGYFFATFSNNVTSATLQAQFAVSTAQAYGIPKGAYLATDWETGDGNVVTGSIEYNTQAILATMDVIAKAGYKPMLYSGAALLRNNIYTSRILAKYPNSLWVASYPTMSAVSTANMGYFPSMNGVALWQFSSNWHGLNVDVSIAVIDTANVASPSTQSPAGQYSSLTLVNYDELGRFTVTRPSGAQLYSSSKLTSPLNENGKPAIRSAGGTYKIYDQKDGAVLAGGANGKEQWFSQADGITKINPLAKNSKAWGSVAYITADDAYTQAETKPGKGIQHLPKGTSWKVFGREGKYLVVGGSNGGKYLNADKCKIILY